MKEKNAIIGTGSVTSAAGFQAAGVRCGLKQSGPDMALIYSDRPAHAAAMFTTNKVPAHCIVLNQKKIKSGRGQAIIINSGNANCCTGEQGKKDALEMMTLAAEKLHIDPEYVFGLSTGVIGEAMPMQKIRTGIDLAVDHLSANGGIEAAKAIMTTDTVPKHGRISFRIDGTSCTIGAMAKGSGMINPNLATMFCLLTTDAAVSAPLLQDALREAVGDSLNALTVDGEMSTNDCVLLLANGASGCPVIKQKNESYSTFATALKKLAEEMAKKIAIDGEGATKLVTITVTGAKNSREAKQAAKAIANSMLVKTAIFGNDPNWGRIVQSAGASGAEIDVHAFRVTCAGITVADNGQNVFFDTKKMNKRLARKSIDLAIDLGVGDATARVFTCDLTYDYISINAEYHT